MWLQRGRHINHGKNGKMCADWQEKILCCLVFFFNLFLQVTERFFLKENKEFVALISSFRVTNNLI